MLRFKCYGLRFEWLKLKFNSGFYPREGRYAVYIYIYIHIYTYIHIYIYIYIL